MARKPHDEGSPEATRPIIHRPVSSAAGREPAEEPPLEDDDRLLSPAARLPGDQEEDAALRPRRFDEFIGQRKIVENMAVYVEAARRRGDALDHVLLAGPP